MQPALRSPLQERDNVSQHWIEPTALFVVKVRQKQKFPPVSVTANYPRFNPQKAALVLIGYQAGTLQLGKNHAERRGRS